MAGTTPISWADDALDTVTDAPERKKRRPRSAKAEAINLVAATGLAVLSAFIAGPAEAGVQKDRPATTAEEFTLPQCVVWPYKKIGPALERLTSEMNTAATWQNNQQAFYDAAKAYVGVVDFYWSEAVRNGVQFDRQVQDRYEEILLPYNDAQRYMRRLKKQLWIQ